MTAPDRCAHGAPRHACNEPAAPEPSDVDAIEALLATHRGCIADCDVRAIDGHPSQGYEVTFGCGTTAPIPDDVRGIVGAHDHHLATVLARYVAAQKAEAWDRGYMHCDDDYETHMNHTPLLDCDCPADPLSANPYRREQEARDV